MTTLSNRMDLHDNVLTQSGVNQVMQEALASLAATQPATKFESVLKIEQQKVIGITASLCAGSEIDLPSKTVLAKDVQRLSQAGVQELRTEFGWQRPELISPARILEKNLQILRTGNSNSERTGQPDQPDAMRRGLGEQQAHFAEKTASNLHMLANYSCDQNYPIVEHDLCEHTAALLKVLNHEPWTVPGQPVSEVAQAAQSLCSGLYALSASRGWDSNRQPQPAAVEALTERLATLVLDGPSPAALSRFSGAGTALIRTNLAALAKESKSTFGTSEALVLQNFNKLCRIASHST